MDLWQEEGEMFYDLVLRITEVKDDGMRVTGMEYVLPTPEHAEGQLSLAWDIEEGGPRTGPLSSAELMSLDRVSVHPVVALGGEHKGRWSLREDCQKPEADARECPEDWWLLEGRPMREMVFNPAMW